MPALNATGRDAEKESNFGYWITLSQQAQGVFTADSQLCGRSLWPHAVKDAIWADNATLFFQRSVALQEVSRKKPCPKNRVEEKVEKAVLAFAIDKPAHGQLRVSNELKKQGIFVSPGGVRCIWVRHDLEIFPKRLKALEAKAAQENLILTEEQLRAMERVIVLASCGPAMLI